MCLQHHRLGLRVAGSGSTDPPVVPTPTSSAGVPGVTGPVPVSPEAKEHAHSHVMTTRMTVITMVLYVGCVREWHVGLLRADHPSGKDCHVLQPLVLQTRLAVSLPSSPSHMAAPDCCSPL